MAKCKSCGKPFRLEPAVVVEVLPEFAVAARKKTKTTRRIAVCLSNDGAGKSTTAVNLAAGLALVGFKVLLIDTDNHGTGSSSMLGVDQKAGLPELVCGEVEPDEALLKARDRLWTLTGGKALAGLKRIINEKEAEGELAVTEALSTIDRQYDFVIVDSAPGWDPLAVNVLFYVEELLVPLSLEVLTVQGLADFDKAIAMVRKYRENVALKYLLPTFKNDRVSKGSDQLQRLNELYGSILCEPIRYNNGISEAPGYGQTIFEYAPGSPGAQDYRNLVRRVAGDDSLLR